MRARRGFTLVELLISLVILTVVMTGLGRFVGSFLHGVGTSSARTVATAVAQEWLETIRADRDYPNLVPNYNGNVVTGFPGYPAMQRTTRAVRTTGTTPRRDYTTITVTVTEPNMGTPINMTIVVAAP
ncbi:MAG TPA: prepilin-type N-terminal cleavage/methylation domain-containing protein [Gemmatimonadales bacterium]|nr:prepilin-type N-terminal cleavage/methylation domain-containing protein [Gemmatimonadales bacterium]